MSPDNIALLPKPSVSKLDIAFFVQLRNKGWMLIYNYQFLYQEYVLYLCLNFSALKMNTIFIQIRNHLKTQDF